MNKLRRSLFSATNLNAKIDEDASGVDIEVKDVLEYAKSVLDKVKPETILVELCNIKLPYGECTISCLTSKVPAQISALTNIHKLDIRNNRIKELPPCLQHLVSYSF